MPTHIQIREPQRVRAIVGALQPDGIVFIFHRADYNHRTGVPGAPKIKKQGEAMEARRVLLCAVVMLAGCGPSKQEIREQQARRDLIARNKAEDMAAVQACKSAYPFSERSATNVVPFARCMLDAVNKLHYGRDDLLVAVTYKRLELAEKCASGQITVTQYESQYAEYAAEANTQRQLRRNQAQVALAAQQQANAAACMAAQQKIANDQSEADARAAANQTNSSPAAGLSSLAATALVIADEANERRACNP
jgi:hypothetical protein